MGRLLDPPPRGSVRNLPTYKTLTRGEDSRRA
jgi:hypothetical protein